MLSYVITQQDIKKKDSVKSGSVLALSFFHIFSDKFNGVRK